MATDNIAHCILSIKFVIEVIFRYKNLNKEASPLEVYDPKSLRKSTVIFQDFHKIIMYAQVTKLGNLEMTFHCRVPL